MERRHFVQSAFGTCFIGLAGCTGSSDSEGSNDSGGVMEETVYEGSKTPEINEDYYSYYEFSFDEPTTLEYTANVTDGPNIDVILTDSTNFRYYEDGSEWKYVSEGSDLDTSYADVEVDLDENDWVLILDNTDKGSATPPADMENNRVSVELEYEAYR